MSATSAASATDALVEEIAAAPDAQEKIDDLALLRDLIDEAGPQQRVKSAAEKAYKSSRDKIAALLVKLFGAGPPLLRVVASKYAAEVKEVGHASVVNRALIAAVGIDRFIDEFATVGVGLVESKLGDETARTAGIIVDGTVQQLRIEEIKQPKDAKGGRRA